MVGRLMAVAWIGLAAPLAAAAERHAPCSDAEAFPALAGSQCLVVPAPLDHGAGEDGGTVDLFLRRFPAARPPQRRGEVWLVAGGPGESGAAFYPLLTTLRRAFPDHDLVVPDHRGTGYSGKLCPEQESPDSADGIALAGEEWGPCIGTLHADPGRTHAFTVTNAAHDLSMLIEGTRGDGEVLVYAVSYGTQLALRMLQVAPVALDGVILDGLVPPDAAPQWDLSHRTRVVDEVGRSLLTPAQADGYRRLLETASEQAWLDKVPGRDLRMFFGALLNFPELRARIPALVESLSDGDSALLARTAADLTAVLARMNRYPQSPPSLPLVMLIGASENNARPELTRAVVDSEAHAALFTSPIPGFLVEPPVPLYPKDPWFGKVPASLPRTLVIHGTLDPNTPYAGARAHYAMLADAAGESHFSTVDGGAHLLSFTAPDCFVDAATAFVDEEPVPVRCTLRVD